MMWIPEQASSGKSCYLLVRTSALQSLIERCRCAGMLELYRPILNFPYVRTYVLVRVFSICRLFSLRTFQVPRKMHRPGDTPE